MHIVAVQFKIVDEVISLTLLLQYKQENEQTLHVFIARFFTKCIAGLFPSKSGLDKPNLP